MRWFACKLRSFCYINGVSDFVSVDYSLRIVMANSEEEAKASAEALPREDCSYKNHLGEDVEWRFDSVEVVEDLNVAELASGMEVYSWIQVDRPADEA